jgi:putative hydrolase of the HAD superfamily
MTITHVFFDVGGVLGTPGWDTEQRTVAADHFALDAVDFDHRHQDVVGMFEEGRMTLDEYLDVTVFHTSRAFTRDEFKAFMRAQSAPFPHSIAVARELADGRRYRLMTINNESAELNLHRLHRFRLIEIFATFFSSCWLGVMKPSRRIYELALAMSQAHPAHSVFIGDREQNLAPASALGMHTVRYSSPGQLVGELAALGVVTSGQGER